MKYLVLLMADGELPAWDSLSPEEQQAGLQQFTDFSVACRARDGVALLAGEALGPSREWNVVQTRSGQRQVTDGPYAEAVEQLGGFYLMEAPDVETVVELLAILPAYDIQISPVIDPWE